MAAALESMGQNVDAAKLSWSSVRRDRQNMRSEIANKIKERFEVNGPVTFHWDGKMLREMSGREMVDRLPIYVSGPNI